MQIRHRLKACATLSAYPMGECHVRQYNGYLLQIQHTAFEMSSSTAESSTSLMKSLHVCQGFSRRKPATEVLCRACSGFLPLFLGMQFHPLGVQPRTTRLSAHKRSIRLTAKISGRLLFNFAAKHRLDQAYNLVVLG